MAWTSVNPVTVGNPTKKSDFDKLWDNVQYFLINHDDSGYHTKPFLDVKAYGAVGDDSTDDTTAIYNAEQAVESIGGGLFFPKGTYKVTDGFYFRGSVSILGEGRHSVLKQYGSSFSTTPVLLYYQSPTNTTYNASGALSAGDKDLTFSSVSGLSIGQEVFLQLGEATYDASQPYTAMFNVISNIAGTTVTFRVPFPEDVNGTTHYCLSLTRIVENVSVANIGLEADSAAQPDQAMYIERCRNVKLSNVWMNHTGALINAQSENVVFENIYSKRARYYGSYSGSGNVAGGWGFRNFRVQNLFCEDTDHNGLYLEAEGRGATVENMVYGVGSGYASSGYGIWVGGNCKGINIKNYHANAPAALYSSHRGIIVTENAEVITENVFLYNASISIGFLKNHQGMLGWDAGTGTMTYYSKIKQYTVKLNLTDSMSGATKYTLPSGIYKQIKVYVSSLTGVTGFYFYIGPSDSYAGDYVSNLVAGTMVDLSSVEALNALGPDGYYPFNNYTAKKFAVATSTVTPSAYLILNIEYYAIANDAAQGMMQEEI